MNDIIEETQEAPLGPDELTLLKQRAKTMGITHHPSIGIEKLKEKINAKLEGDNIADAIHEKQLENTAHLQNTRSEQIETPAQKALREKRVKEGMQRKKATRMIRVRVANMNPNKKEWEGEIFTVSNRVVGTIKKYVPYNNESGWHIPYMLYLMLKEKDCQVFHTTKGPRGNKIRKGKLIKEFAIEVLPPLTMEELKDLATQQAMAGTVGT